MDEIKRHKPTIVGTVEAFTQRLRGWFRIARPPELLCGGPGWGVYRTASVVKLRRADDDETFGSDAEVYLHVWRGSRAGVPECAKALDILRDRAPAEYERVRDYAIRVLGRVPVSGGRGLK